MVGIESEGKQWKSIYTIGAAATFIVIVCTFLDIFLGFYLGGDMSVIPKTAVGRFAQFQDNRLVGLYYLDLLNMTTSIIMVPAFFSLYAAHRTTNTAYAAFSMILFVIGTVVFITNNTALPMLELSNKYYASSSEQQKTLIAAAGEAMIARGAHGSPGAFPGFTLTLISELMMSFVMLRGKIFTKATSYMGISGSILLMIYMIFVTFIPGMESVAMLVATPGGLLALVWMIMLDIRLFQLGR